MKKQSRPSKGQQIHVCWLSFSSIIWVLQKQNKKNWGICCLSKGVQKSCKYKLLPSGKYICKGNLWFISADLLLSSVMILHYHFQYLLQYVYYLVGAKQTSAGHMKQSENCLWLHINQFHSQRQPLFLVPFLTNILKSNSTRSVRRWIPAIVAATAAASLIMHAVLLARCSMAYKWSMYNVPERSNFFQEFNLDIWQFLNFKICQNSNF